MLDGIPELREFVRGFMTEPTEILEQVTTEDEPGYPRKSWQTKERTVSFTLPVGQRELLRAQQAGIEVESRRFLPFGTEVTEADILEVNGERWNITGIPEKTEAMSADVEVYLSRRT